ncbi:thioredoxin domain-containing protein [Halostella sp. PRR32]|uniref:DsbA family protein n=1 Tax=Halostella sp. PRR32 TaxID=3098147 RepID=UPI002B1D9A7C|nr:thioredoxin domain-containing protein [Halostella sp. PRR32]
MADDVPRRRVVGAIGTAVTASFGGCASVLEAMDTSDTGTERADTVTQRRPDTETETRISRVESADESFDVDGITIRQPGVSFAGTAPGPDDPGQYEYATMGSADATATATVYGNWKCPHTQTFVLEQLDGIVAEFVRSEDIALEFRFLGYRSGEPFLGSDAPRAARAGLAVWNADPANYWAYLAYVFENQPQEQYEWAQRDFLEQLAEEAGVRGVSQIGRALDDDAYASAVRATTDAASDAGVSTVPRVVVDGDVTAPTVDLDETRAQLERASDD